MSRITCFVVVVLAMAAGCQSESAKPTGDEYYYYPSKNVYYDVARSRYLYSLDSGRTWDSLASKNAAPAIEGDREVLYSDNPDIWQSNELHRDTYHGVMLNIVNEQSLKSKQPPVVKKPETTTGNTVSTPQDEGQKERKRPIKRFFQRLFGKKK